jgi:hypothetical protein
MAPDRTAAVISATLAPATPIPTGMAAIIQDRATPAIPAVPVEVMAEEAAMVEGAVTVAAVAIDDAVSKS